MLSRLILPLPLLLLPLLAALAAPASSPPRHLSAGATVTVTTTAGTSSARATAVAPSTTATTTAATPAATPEGDTTPAATAGPSVSTSAAAPPWNGLPTRTYANLKKKILGDPINIAFEGTQGGIIAAFAKIGWVKADPLSLHNDERMAVAAVRRRSYPTAPVSNLYLFGRPEDFAVEHEIGTVSRRDHARFWDTTRRDKKTGLDLFIGDASRDIAIKILRTKKGLPKGTTHRINGNLDQERDMIVTLLRKAGVVTTVIMEPGMGRTTNALNGGGDRFYTDGKCAVVVLKG